MLKVLVLGCVVLLVATSCVARPEPSTPESISEQIQHASGARELASGFEPWALTSIRVFPVSGAHDEYVAITDSNPCWWGEWCWIRVRRGVIAEIVWGELMEQSMYRLCGFRDPRFSGCLVAGYGMTHQGNGRYYLLHVHGGVVETLIQTRAVDVHYCEGLVLEDEVLAAAYTDFNGDAFGDVVLTGREHLVTPEEVGEPLEKCDWTPRTPQVIRKVFLWHPTSHCFERFVAGDIGSYDFH